MKNLKKLLALFWWVSTLSEKLPLSGNCRTNAVVHIRAVYFIYMAVLLSVICLSVLQQHLEIPDMGLIVLHSVGP